MTEPTNETSRSTDHPQSERPASDLRPTPSDDRETNLDKTLADSFPASDPPSTDPNPGGTA